MAIAFDKLAFVRKLEGASIPRNQAEAMSEAFHDAVSETVATKADIVRLEADISSFRAEVNSDLAALKAEVNSDIAALRADIAGFKAEIKTDIAALRVEAKTDFAAFRAEFKADLNQSTSNLKLWAISVGIGSVVTIIGAIIGLLRLLGTPPS